MIEDVKDKVDEIPGSDSSRATTIVFDEIYHRKSGVLPLSKSVGLIETLGEGFNN